VCRVTVPSNVSVQASHLLDIASCCAILFPIVWSIQQLKTEARSEAAAAAAAASASQEDSADAETSDAPAIKEKLLQLRGFYSQVVCRVHHRTLAIAALCLRPNAAAQSFTPALHPCPPGRPLPLQHPHPPLPRARRPRLQAVLHRRRPERGNNTRLLPHRRLEVQAPAGEPVSVSLLLLLLLLLHLLLLLLLLLVRFILLLLLFFFLFFC
jgi:hypothetical protein